MLHAITRPATRRGSAVLAIKQLASAASPTGPAPSTQPEAIHSQPATKVAEPAVAARNSSCA
ncbi:hypothetical protein D9M68_572470 [compost metagenome]